MRMFRPQPTQSQRLALAAAALLALAVTNCPAQGHTLQTPQEQAAPDQDSTCPPPAKEPQHAVNFQPPPAQPYSQAERACWIGWDEAQQLAKQGANARNVQWLDVRETGAAQRLRLIGALAVPRQQVAHSAALRGLNLLILGEDVDLRALSRQCVAWRESRNFQDVHVVLGGVRAWRLAGQPVQFDARAANPPEPPEVLTPAAYWRGLAEGLWRIATLGVDATQAQALDHPVALALPAADAGALTTLRQTLAQTPKDKSPSETPAPSWLVVTNDAQTQAQLQALWNQQHTAQKTPAVLWLGGGLRAYRAYLEQQQQIAAHAGHVLPRLCGMRS
jgi:rhodanese-related sulfurtransferase